jgi:adenylate kinase family enzyme
VFSVFAVRKDSPGVGDVHVDGTDWKKPKRRDQLVKSEPAPLYVSRPLLNGDALVAWAKAQGFATTLQPDDMHVTLAYSKQPVDWMACGESFHQGDKLEVKGGPRVLERFGPDGEVVVLLFASWDLKWRQAELIDAGCSSDWPDYQPHVSISWNAGDIDLDKIEPYTGPLIFGPELFKPIVDSWKDTIVEKYRPDQARDPGGENGGQWVKEGAGLDDSALEGVHPDALATLGPERLKVLRAMIAGGASAEEIGAVLRPAAEHASSIEATIAEGALPTQEFWDGRVYDGGRKLPEVVDGLVADAQRFAGPGGPLQAREATVVTGPPAAGKSTLAETLALRTRSAIWDSDEAKKLIPEFRGGIGAGAVHAESKFINNIVGARLLETGANVVVPVVGHDPSTTGRLIDLLKTSGYHVTVVNVDVSPDEAMRRMAARYMSSNRLIPPDYFNSVSARPKAAYEDLKTRGAADGYAQVDANGPRGSEYVRESVGVRALAAQQPVFGKGGSVVHPAFGGRARGQDRDSRSADGSPEVSKADDVDLFCKIAGVSELGLVFGWGIVCKDADGADYRDPQGNHIPEDAMVAATTEFMKSVRVHGDMHSRGLTIDAPAGIVVHSFPLTSDIAKALGIDTKQTGWLVATAPDPAMLAKFRSGEYTGFSIGGRHLEIDGKPVEDAA